jgi:hypothetical protein
MTLVLAAAMLLPNAPVAAQQRARPQIRILPVATTSIAPTLANIIGLDVPGDLDGSCLDLDYPDAPGCKR